MQINHSFAYDLYTDESHILPLEACCTTTVSAVLDMEALDVCVSVLPSETSMFEILSMHVKDSKSVGYYLVDFSPIYSTLLSNMSKWWCLCSP